MHTRTLCGTLVSELPYMHSFNSAQSVRMPKMRCRIRARDFLEINHRRVQKTRILYSLLPFHYTGGFEEILNFVWRAIHIGNPCEGYDVHSGSVSKA